MTNALGELGRFAEPAMYILVSLSESPKHGYAIMTDVETISGVPMGPGTLYGALARLERRGLIEALEPEERRRPYRLTALGATTLQAQLLQLNSGSVLELDRKVGEAIDIYVNNRLVARGEVVIVDERLGVTMTEIIKDGDSAA